MKKDSSADSALNPMKNKQYFNSLKNYFGDILFAGINDDENQIHSCAFEKLLKE